jgi:hypothetical protein
MMLVASLRGTATPVCSGADKIRMQRVEREKRSRLSGVEMSLGCRVLTQGVS